MVKYFGILALLWFALGAQPALAGFQGGVQVKTARHDNFNLANGETVPAEETVQTVMASLTWFKASSKQFVWLINGFYSYSEYDKYAHLSGATASLLGGMFYRVNESNSMTFKLGKRERNYDDESLSLYQDDAHFAILQLSHRLSPTTMVNEKLKYEENEPHYASNKYASTGAQLWLEWRLARGTSMSMGYSHTTREYKSRGEEYNFDEPYISVSYSLARNMYTRIGYSKMKMTQSNGDRAYNSSAYLAIGFGF